jgi:DNA-binding NarL/FixJ family response regulator
MEIASQLDVILIDAAFHRFARARESELRGLLSGESLTAREHEILGQVRAGFRNSAIAKGMNLTERTVEFHVGHLLKKLGANNRTEAVFRANVLGL